MVVSPSPKLRILLNLQCAPHALGRKPGALEVEEDSELRSWTDHHCSGPAFLGGRLGTAVAFQEGGLDPRIAISRVAIWRADVSDVSVVQRHRFLASTHPVTLDPHRARHLEDIQSVVSHVVPLAHPFFKSQLLEQPIVKKKLLSEHQEARLEVPTAFSICI